MAEEPPALRVAVAGNPNCGKTTLFNALTGGHQHVGNWPGVTVDKVTGYADAPTFDVTDDGLRPARLALVDLPGLYSLNAYTPEETVARDHLLGDEVDVILDIVDGTNLARNLYLTLQLLEIGRPLVVAVTMMDELEARGEVLELAHLAEQLGVEVVGVAARRREGLHELQQALVRAPPREPLAVDYGALEGRVSGLEQRLMASGGCSAPRALALTVLLGDHGTEHLLPEGSWRTDSDDATVETVVSRRYGYIEALVAQVRQPPPEGLGAHELLDRVVTDRWLGVPIFLAVLWVTFQLTFTVAAPLVALIDLAFGQLAASVGGALGDGMLGSFVGDALIGGVGFMLVFVPNIFMLFFLLALLEDSGYLPRAAFLLDRAMHSMGLHGRSFMPLLMGFGCNVPALMATRTIENPRDRLLTMLVAPFMTCSARLVVYVLLAGALFGEQAGTVIFLLYLLSIAVTFGTSFLLRHSLFQGEPTPFLMELPPYRLPQFGIAASSAWLRTRIYARRITTVVVPGISLVWLMASLPMGVEYGSEASLLGTLGRVIEPLVAPLGFDWRIATALLFGFVAKEIVVGAMGTIWGTGDDTGALSDAVAASMTPLVALEMMVFTLVYVPCLTVIATMLRESGSRRWTLFSIALSLVLAYALTALLRFVALALGVDG